MPSKIISYRDAISLAMADEMRSDPKVLFMGEDIGESGGPLKTSVGLYEEFGPIRVRDTPIAEEAFVGAALGLAVTGYRPIVEIMFADFLGVCFDQIINSVAKHRFMSGGSVNAPMVIRVIGGGGLRFGPQHSQTGESWLMPFPGIKVVAASGVAEAYGMLRAAIRDPNPVVVIEHKALLGTEGQIETKDGGLKEIEEPAILREGDQVTVVASLMMVSRAQEAAEKLAADGISVEVIDLRVISPLKADIIINSVKKTGRLLTVEEQMPCGGWGSAVIAEVVGKAFDYLDAPPRRIGLPAYPLPFSPPLEDAAIPDKEDIESACRELLQGV